MPTLTDYGWKGLKKARFLWLRGQQTLTVENQARVAELSRLYPKTGLAHRLKEAFGDFFGHNPTTAESYLMQWKTWAQTSGLAPFVEFAQTLQKHWRSVLRWFTSGIANGMLEGFNSLVQAAKAKARGYRSERTLITMIYLLGGRLNYRFAQSL